MDGLESMVAELERVDFATEEEAVAALALAIAAANAEMQSALTVERGAVQIQMESAGRLQKIIERIWQKVKEIANKFGAFSYSVSVGFPAGFSVDIEWAGPKQ